MTYPLTVCIIARNEEKNIEECLKRLKNYKMEIIVTDTGSSDKTKEIASRYADKVLDFKWNNDFSAARNFCAQHATNDWVLALDCDEYMENINLAALRSNMFRYAKLPGSIPIKNLARMENGEICYVTTERLRLYNRHLYKFANAIRETLVPISGNTCLSVGNDSFKVPAGIVHHGYNVSDVELKLKFERRLSILYSVLDKAVGKEQCAYITFLIGEAYRAIGNHQSAVDFFKLSLSLECDLEIDYVQICMAELADVYLAIGYANEAAEIYTMLRPILKNYKFTDEHSQAILRTGTYVDRISEYIVDRLLDRNQSSDEVFRYSCQRMIEIYEIFNLHRLAIPYITRYRRSLPGRNFRTGSM
jgi:glycosyltransferase involved in cell wall biosynthesis